MSKIIDTRRYDIDWLRSLAFILLIFYHIGQFYVADWGWHVKSDYLSEVLKNIMLLVNQWRMPLIFLISGVALSLVEAKISSTELLKIRFNYMYTLGQVLSDSSFDKCYPLSRRKGLGKGN